MCRLTTRPVRLLATALLVVTLGGCAARGGRQADTPAPSAPTSRLSADLTAILRSPDASRALWGVHVRSLDSNEELFEHQNDQLLLPASTMKIVTLAVAAEQLGWDHRYETTLLSSAPIVDGTLEGDLIVRGDGDPSINTATGGDESVFDDWAAALAQAGITTIAGHVVGDDNLVEEPVPGFGWSWDDLSYGYAATVGALQHRDNSVDLTVHAGSVAGEDTLVEVSPPDIVRVVNRVETDLPDADVDLTLRRLPDGGVEVVGWIPASASPAYRSAAVPNPTLFFVEALRQTLERQGIAVAGEAVDLDEAEVSVDETQLRPLVRHQSPPLSDIAMTLMGMSRNLYAEALLQALDGDRRPRSAAGGRSVAQQVLESWGIGPARVAVADGSGLSRYNFVTARTLVDILQRMATDPRHAEPFRASLAVAGQSGTLSTRLRGTAADGNLRAKTGSMSNVRGLSGYVSTADGETLAFAILANNFPDPGGPVVSAIDDFVDRLARSRRSDRED